MSVFVFNKIRSEKMTCRAMLNQYWRICSYRFPSELKSIIGIGCFNFPVVFIWNFARSTHFLKSRKFRMMKWRLSNRFQEQFSWCEICVSWENDLLSKMNNIISIAIILISSLNDENWASIGTGNVGARCARIRIFSCWDFFADINNETAVCLFVRQHDFVSESKKSIRRISLRNFLQSSLKIRLHFSWA